MLLFPHRKWYAGEFQLEVECCFRTGSFSGSVTTEIRSDATIGNLKNRLLKAIEDTHMKLLPGMFAMTDFKPLFFVLVAGDSKELLYWKAKDDYDRITQQTDFVESLQKIDVRKYINGLEMKVEWKCSLLCCTEHELTAEIGRRRTEHEQRRSASEIGRIRTPSPDMIGSQTRPPGVVLPLHGTLKAPQQRWQPDTTCEQQWRQTLYEAEGYLDARWHCLRIHNMMERLQTQSYTSSHLRPQAPHKSQKIQNKAIPKSHSRQNDSPPEP